MTSWASGELSSTTDTLAPNSWDHVGASTTPVTRRPLRAWKARRAASVCGPKMPSSVMPSARCSASTPGPVLPALSTTGTSPPDVWAVAARDPEPPAAADSVGAAGAVTMAALTTADTPLRRVRSRRLITARSRRWRERRSERCQSSWEARSRRGASYGMRSSSVGTGWLLLFVCLRGELTGSR